MRIGYLKEDINEMRTSRRIYWKRCYRIVDEKGQDLIVPWSWTKREARETAKIHNIELIGMKNENVKEG
jgi:hypothetical protein